MKIINYNEFNKCFEEYKSKFPDTYTTTDQIIKILNQDYKETGGSDLLVIQVASDWEDRCYGFKFAGDEHYPKYEFVGMTKCLTMSDNFLFIPSRRAGVKKVERMDKILLRRAMHKYQQDTQKHLKNYAKNNV